MTLAELVSAYQPESYPHPQETWLEIARRLWTQEPRYTVDRLMRTTVGWGQWVSGPVELHGGYVQDGHHRVVVALGLGRHDRPVPFVFVTKE